MMQEQVRELVWKEWEFRLADGQLGKIEIRELVKGEDPGEGWTLVEMCGKRMAWRVAVVI